MSHWIYGAVLLGIASGLFGLIVGGLVVRRVWLTGAQPTPPVGWLLIALVLLSLSQLMEQSRVLLFRLSYDGLIERDLFASLYDATWNVAASKVIGAVALVTAGAVKLCLYCDRPDGSVVRWAWFAGAATLVGWVVLAIVIDRFLP